MADFVTSPFDDLIGLRLTQSSGDRVEGECAVTESLHQPAGIVHGGVYCTIVETIASVGGQLWLQAQNRDAHVVGVNNNTNFLRAIGRGQLRAVGVPVHRGRSQQLWNVEIRDAESRLIARGDVRLANLDNPAPAAP